MNGTAVLKALTGVFLISTGWALGASYGDSNAQIVDLADAQVQTNEIPMGGGSGAYGGKGRHGGGHRPPQLTAEEQTALGACLQAKGITPPDFSSAQPPVERPTSAQHEGMRACMEQVKPRPPGQIGEGGPRGRKPRSEGRTGNVSRPSDTQIAAFQNCVAQQQAAAGAEAVMSTIFETCKAQARAE